MREISRQIDNDVRFNNCANRLLRSGGQKYACDAPDGRYCYICKVLCYHVVFSGKVKNIRYDYIMGKRSINWEVEE